MVLLRFAEQLGKQLGFRRHGSVYQGGMRFRRDSDIQGCFMEKTSLAATCLYLR
jgi:hypothetical protein